MAGEARHDESAGGSWQPSPEALLEAMRFGDGTPDLLRSAVTRYVCALPEARVPPERVLASIKELLASADQRAAIAREDWKAMVVRWFLDEYYRPDRQSGLDDGRTRTR
jgi:hypothetical protein